LVLLAQPAHLFSQLGSGEPAGRGGERQHGGQPNAFALC
jgi:hypothetical protein